MEKKLTLTTTFKKDSGVVPGMFTEDAIKYRIERDEIGKIMKDLMNYSMSGPEIELFLNLYGGGYKIQKFEEMKIAGEEKKAEVTSHSDGKIIQSGVLAYLCISA